MLNLRMTMLLILCGVGAAATSACSRKPTSFNDLTAEQQRSQPAQVAKSIEDDAGWRDVSEVRDLHSAALAAADASEPYLFISSGLGNRLQLSCPVEEAMPPICHNRYVHAFGWTKYSETLDYPVAVRADHDRRESGNS